MKQLNVFGCRTGGGGVKQINEDLDRAFYLRELVSEECRCGRDKNKGQSFCIRCYRRLPSEIKPGIYAKIGAGYEENYDEAVKFLGD